MKRIVMILVLAMLAAAAPQAQDAERLFTAAMNTELVDGNLKQAIEQYRKVAESRDRALAVKALVRMAECYQKLGDVESKKIYERIVRDYGDQKEAVTLAQARLGPRTEPTRTGLTTQRVLPDEADRVSPDGRYVSFTDWDTSNLALRDLTTNKVRAVTSDGVLTHPQEQYPMVSAFSRDGRQIAYDWYFESEDRSVLRIIATAEGTKATPKTLYDNAEVNVIAPTDWSADGKWIAVVIRRKDRTAQIGIVSAADGSLRVLKSVDWAGVGGLRFSPDGAMLAYHRPAREGAFERDVFVISVDGTREVVAAGGPSDDSALEWTPDGERLLISSDRGGSMAVWSVLFRSHTPSPTFQLVKSDIGAISSMGLTQSGALFYNLLPGGAEIYVAQFDAAAGQLASTPVQPIQQFKGLNTAPQWSSDGRFLAYLSRREVPAPIKVARPVLAILSMETGQVREIFPTLAYTSMGRWSPDDRLFIARGADLKGRPGIVKIDASTGEASLVVPNDTCSDAPSWSPKGTSFFCYRWGKDEIVEVDAESGNVLRTYSGVGMGTVISPDGLYLLHASREGAPSALNILSLANGESRELLRLSPETQVRQGAATFSPDSRSVMFFGRLKGIAGMWRMPVDGGVPQRLNIDLKDVGSWQLNHKTGQVAFGAGRAPRHEVWKMENFLPDVKVAR